MDVIVVALESFVLQFSDYTILILFFSIFFNIIAAIFGFIPTFWITTINIAFFGISGGFILSLFGEALGEFIAFLIYRYGYDNYVHKYEKVQNNKYVKRINSSSKKKALSNIVLIRLIPFMPAELANLGGAMASKVNVVEFTIASTIGKTPSLILEIAFLYLAFNNLSIFILISSVTIILLVLNNHGLFKSK